jgi:hypothetical protein
MLPTLLKVVSAEIRPLTIGTGTAMTTALIARAMPNENDDD